ncbi:hypothetical protein H045_01885 [Pseudomonas poae RE*1-1-14]|nr:hypothetical protein H045_01885 [Pseudomonas poae RE*1-1-14]
MSSVIKSRIAILLIGHTEPVVARRIGNRRDLELQAGFYTGRWCGGGQAGKDVEDVICAQTSRFKYQLHRHQHRFETRNWHSSQYLHHDSITVGMTPQYSFEKP